MRHHIWNSLRADERLIRCKLTVLTLLFYMSASAVVIGLVTMFEPSSIAKREYRTQVSTAPQANTANTVRRCSSLEADRNLQTVAVNYPAGSELKCGPENH
jgi:hypothetical protein